MSYLAYPISKKGESYYSNKHVSHSCGSFLKAEMGIFEWLSGKKFTFGEKYDELGIGKDAFRYISNNFDDISNTNDKTKLYRAFSDAFCSKSDYAVISCDVIKPVISIIEEYNNKAFNDWYEKSKNDPLFENNKNTDVIEWVKHTAGFGKDFLEVLKYCVKNDLNLYYSV